MLGRTDLALKAWERALELEPANEAVLHSVALFHSRGGDPLVGLQYIDRLLAENPYLAEYHWMRCRLLEQAGNLEESVRAAERTIELDPTAVYVRAWLVDAYQRTNQSAAGQQQRELIERMRGS
jgi:tetratricopeptide (TPR) repeat protein